MEGKPRGAPLKLLVLEALLRRIPRTHPQYPHIQVAHRIEAYSYRGELEADYQIDLIPNTPFTVMKNLRMQGSHSFFQLDTTLFSKTVIITLEVKTMKGALKFDQDFHQLIRTYEDQVDKYPDPLSQIATHRRELLLLLKKHKFPPIPMVNLVVVANRYSFIQATNPQLGKIIIPSDYIPEKMIQLAQQYTHECFSENDVKRLRKLLNKLHTPKIPKMLRQFRLSHCDLLLGVHCPSCKRIPLKKVHGGWFCPSCNATHKEAYKESLEDYVLLVGHQINNRQAREFLLLHDKYSASRILRDLALPFDGVGKARTYTLPFPAFATKR